MIHRYEHDGINATVQFSSIGAWPSDSWDVYIYYPNETHFNRFKSFEIADAYVRMMFDKHDRDKKEYRKFCIKYGIPC